MNTSEQAQRKDPDKYPYDGGPAFPRKRSIHRIFAPEEGFTHDLPQEGMSLRDWFAGKALQSLATCADYDYPAKNLALRAYQFADAMLECRSRHLTGKSPQSKSA